MRVRRETERPEGASVSYTQLSQPCGLRLKFKRQKVADRTMGIFLLYGRALHGGIEARSRGRARSDEEAVEMAVRMLHSSVAGARLPIQWDDEQERNKDGSITAASFGNLYDLPSAEWWLRQQVKLYLERYPDQQVVRTEHHIFVPLTPPSGGVSWTRNWSLECYLDREMKDGSIHDIKSSAKPWGPREVRKGTVQALIYMGAYANFYDRQPSHFEFHVLPRQRGEDGKAKLELQVVRVEWDFDKIQAYINSVVKPQITIIEQEAYVANPADTLCNERWCQYWDWCSFGSGTHI